MRTPTAADNSTPVRTSAGSIPTTFPWPGASPRGMGREVVSALRARCYTRGLVR